MNKLALFVVLFVAYMPLWGSVSEETKIFAEQQIAEIRKAPAVGCAFVQRIAAHGDDCLLYALPQLIDANDLAIRAGSETYTITLLTVVFKIKESVLTKDQIDALDRIADKKNENHVASMLRIRQLLKSD